jgi:crotonobetaine/carnitine-CoA ligase
MLQLATLEQRNVANLLDESAQFGLDRTWITEGWSGRSMTYGEFLEHVSATAQTLAGRFSPGTHVALMLANHIEFIILRYAISCAGLVEVSLNGDQKGSVLRGMLDTAQPLAVIVDTQYLDNLTGCDFDLDKVAVITGDAIAALCAGREPWDARPAVALGPGDTCRILFTSGTTGISKGVVLSHAYEVFVGARWCGACGLNPDDKFLYTTRLFHADAQGLIGAVLHAGCSFVITERFSASQFWATAVKFSTTCFVYVGTILAIINRLGDPPPGHHIRKAFGAGASPGLWESWESRTGIKVIESFGMSECLACCCTSLDGIAVLGACGKALPGMELAIVDELDRVVAPGTRGELVVRSHEPYAMLTGYLNQPEITLERFRNYWFHTGDLGSMDADGNLFFHGRMKDSLRVKGENISAEELQGIVDNHPAIMMSAAVGVPSAMGDEDILLYVQRNAGAEVSPEDICAHVREHAVAFMVPRYIRFVDSLPVSVSEKVSKTDLAREPDGQTWERPDSHHGEANEARQ